MTSSISWIDRAGLAETLARFGAASGSAAPIASLAAVPSPPAPEAVTTSTLAAFEPRGGSLSERLEEFMDWLSRATGCRIAFITDRDGLPLVDRGADADVMAIASSFVQLVEPLGWMETGWRYGLCLCTTAPSSLICCGVHPQSRKVY